MGSRSDPDLEFEALVRKGPGVVGPDALETFPAPKGCGAVRMETDEFTAVCPVTTQPDWYTVVIDYIPDELCLESKSLKMYFWGFRNAGIFCESLAEEIAKTLSQVLKPRDITVMVKQKARGGIAITAQSTITRPSESPSRQPVS